MMSSGPRQPLEPLLVPPVAALPVVGHANLHHVDEGEARMLDGLQVEVFWMVAIPGEASRQKTRPGGDGQRSGAQGRLDGAFRGSVGLPPLSTGRRRLSGGEGEHPVVVNDVGQVEIAPAGVDEVAHTLAEPIALR